MDSDVFTFNLEEPFMRLARPPIVEAVIHWLARAQKPLVPETLSRTLLERFPNYPTQEPMQLVEWSATVTDGNENARSIFSQSKGWQGIRLKSTDGRYIVQFTRDGLIFSQIREYEHWKSFLEAAREAWRVYLEVAEPLETARLGVRFINHIPEATSQSIHKYLRDPPTCPPSLPLKELVYQSTFEVPGHPFNVRVIKVLQPQMPELKASAGLFVDIDVFTTTAILNEPNSMDEALRRMRWLKNKVFFALLTEDAVRAFGGGTP